MAIEGPLRELAQRMGIAADGREHHGAAVEVDRALIVAQHGGDRERASLPAQIEQLENVVNAKLAKRAFDRHTSALLPSAEDAL